MFDSVQPHRRQPTRLPHPWDSPDKNIGVGCHLLLQCMKVKSESEFTQSCPTLHDAMDCSTPGYSQFNSWVRKFPWRRDRVPTPAFLGFLMVQIVKNLPAVRPGIDPWLGKIPLEEDVATYSSILAWRIPMDRGAWWATVHGVAKCWTWLSD